MFRTRRKPDSPVRLVSTIGIFVAVLMVACAGVALGLREGERNGLQSDIDEYERVGYTNVSLNGTQGVLKSEFITFQESRWSSYRTEFLTNCGDLSSPIMLTSSTGDPPIIVTLTPRANQHLLLVTLVVNFTNFSLSSSPIGAYSHPLPLTCSVHVWDAYDPYVILGTAQPVATHDDEFLTLALIVGGTAMLLTLLSIAGMHVKQKDIVVRVEDRRGSKEASPKPRVPYPQTPLATEPVGNEFDDIPLSHGRETPETPEVPDMYVDDIPLQTCLTLTPRSCADGLELSVATPPTPLLPAPRHVSLGPVVTNADFVKLKQLENTSPAAEGWSSLNTYTLKNSSVVKVYTRPRSGSSLMEYLTIGELHVAPDIFFLVNNDMQFRKKWDSYCKDLSILEEYDGERDCAAYWKVAFPMPFTNRDYVFYREHRVDKGSFMSVGRAAPHAAKPPGRSVRVEAFTNDVLLTTSSKGVGWCNYIAVYYEDPKAHIPTSLQNWITAHGIPNYLEGMFKACAKYEADQNPKLQEMRRAFAGED
eukprot:TRINITY_DN3886_c0_g2_i3.p1 TRINITY_DN3886_c0_g2~~TRINITY_DN3886_c0_g2_i3.p1  ORF type:complete len:533 (+),score=109.15 TRINITY_DN3886_c0_g2_i3:747-2345(+)